MTPIDDDDIARPRFRQWREGEDPRPRSVRQHEEQLAQAGLAVVAAGGIATMLLVCGVLLLVFL